MQNPNANKEHALVHITGSDPQTPAPAPVAPAELMRQLLELEAGSVGGQVVSPADLLNQIEAAALAHELADQGRTSTPEP